TPFLRMGNGVNPAQNLADALPRDAILCGQFDRRASLDKVLVNDLLIAMRLIVGRCGDRLFAALDDLQIIDLVRGLWPCDVFTPCGSGNLGSIAVKRPLWVLSWLKPGQIIPDHDLPTGEMQGQGVLVGDLVQLSGCPCLLLFK